MGVHSSGVSERYLGPGMGRHGHLLGSLLPQELGL